MKSVMSHQFSMLPQVNIPRSTFNRSHGYKTTFDAGYLIPVYVDEALPGDTFNLKMNVFARLATQKAAIMDNIFLDCFFFAVPNRLVWDNWKKFCGEQVDPGDSIEYLVPTVTANFAEGELYDYFGIPTQIAGVEVDNLHARAYNLIWNEWFRDQNLQDSVVVDKDDGPDDVADYVILKRGKRYDYFTSCLPFPQKGDDITVPIGVEAPVLGIGKKDQTWAAFSVTPYESNASTRQYDSYQLIRGTVNDDGAFYVEEDPDNSGYPKIRADLTDASAITINALRLAFQTQKLLEKDARGGTRYTEIVRSHFGVTSPDSRMQRPEYLGGGSIYVNIHPVTQLSESGATPQGNIAGIGTVNGRKGFVKSFTEHCVLIGLVCLRADLTYQQGLDRMFSRQERLDFYWPSLAYIGEQAVLNKEIFTQGTAGGTADDDVFGYNERYSEYRYKPSRITGKFRSNATGSLDVWHLCQDFAMLPVLDSDFIEEDPPIERVLAVGSEPDVLFDSYFDLRVARPMPTYATPGLIDHF